MELGYKACKTRESDEEFPEIGTKRQICKHACAVVGYLGMGMCSRRMDPPDAISDLEAYCGNAS